MILQLYFRALVISSALFVSCICAGAAEWHVAPDGKATGDGSKANPWDLKTALNHPQVVKPGETIWLHGGTYKGVFNSVLKGTENAPIIVRQAIGERAILDTGMEKGHALFILDAGSDTWYWGFEVMSSATERPTGIQNRTDLALGVYTRAPRTKLINLIVHDTMLGFGMWSEAPDSEMYGCMSFLHGYSNQAHGLYIQNQTGKKLVAENIFFGNSSYGIHGYTENGWLDHMTFEGNISFNNGGLYRPDFGCNIMIGGTKNVSEGCSLISNYTYFSPEVPRSKGSNQLGYSGGCNNLTLRDNYFITPTDRALVFVKCTNVTMTGNTLYGNVVGFAPGDYPDNKYYTKDKKPTDVATFVRPNKYEPGRANVIIYNWDMKDTVSVDLTPSGLKAGDDYEIRDAQNFLGKPVFSGKYDGKPVELPMAGLEYNAPVAKVAFPPVHTSKEFNVFVVLKAPAK
jgi:hypothetical protein